MPVSVIPSAKQAASKRLKSATARKRRQNQNVEIDELASLVPLAQTSLVPSDKLSVLRLATTFLKLQSFMKESSLVNGSSGEHVSNDFAGLMKEAIDGFLIVLDKEANILYVSDSISNYVGLSQQDVIGQNLVDIAHPESAAEITDCLKPSIVPSLARSSGVEESTVTQFRQFYVKFQPTPKSVSYPVVQVRGNLKVKLPLLRTTDKVHVSAVEPVVMGFTGECRVIESVSSIVEISVSHSSFTMLKDVNSKLTYIEASVKEVIGYDPEEFYANHERFYDFLHPAEYSDLKAMKDKLKDQHAVTPYFRFLTKSGDWVWMQMESITHYKKGTTIPEYYEYKARVLSQGRNKMKCIEQKPQTDDGEQSPQPDHQWQSNNTSILTNTSISTPSLPSSTTSSDELLPASQISVAHGSPSMYSSTGSVGSLSTSSPLSANSAPSSSPHSPLPQPQSSNPFPLSSALALDSSASPAGSNFSGVSNIAQTTSWISSQRQDQQPIPDIAQVPVHSVVTQEVQSGVQRPSDTQNGVQSSPIVENRVQSPPSVSGSTFSTSSTDSGVILPALQNFSSGGSLSPDSCSPYNSPISTVSALPSSVWSPEMGTGLHTAVSTDSIPSATSASVPFQNSPQTSDFVPQAPPINNTFNPQLPSDFNFSGNTSYSQNFDNSDFVPGLDFTMLEPQQFNGSSIPQIHPGDSVLQHILDEMITLNDDSDFSAVPTIPGNGTVNVDTTFIPHSMPGSNSNSSTPFQGFIPEVQDIFQQFS